MLLTLGHLTGLLALAAEIATTEQLPRPLCLKLAMQLWPTLNLYPDQSAEWPTSMHQKQPTA